MTSRTIKKRKNKVKQNIRCILSHFKEPIFPRTISSRSTTYDTTQFKIAYSEKEMFRIYEQSKFIDCRVSIYRSSYAQERPDDQNPEIADLITLQLHIYAIAANSPFTNLSELNTFNIFFGSIIKLNSTT